LCATSINSKNFTYFETNVWGGREEGVERKGGKEREGEGERQREIISMF
jgi:hypothetical protein